jgi:hypothetical protein
VEGEAYGPDDLLPRLTDAIWSELDVQPPRSVTINSFRRNLQRVYVDRLIDFTLNTTNWITISVAGAEQATTPEDVRSLARLELAALSRQIDNLLNRRSLERDTRAHLSETKARVDRALDAAVEVAP